MKKKDLKIGMGVELADGDKFVVMKDSLAGIGTDDTLDLNDYDVNLKSKAFSVSSCVRPEMLDINIVTEVLTAKGLMSFQNDDLEKGYILYNRQEQEKLDSIKTAISLISEFLDSEDHEITNINIGMEGQVDLIYLNERVATISKCEDEVDLNNVIRNIFTPNFD